MYDIQNDYFNNITTEQQTYVLAWFWSRGKGRIQLSHDNVDALILIKNAIQYTGVIYHYRKNVELNITIPTFRRALLNAGCVLTKSHPQSFPIIFSNLIPHFCRGIFDSYGSMCLNKNKYLNISIVYDETFINNLRKYIKDVLDIDTKHYYRYSHTTTVQMMITKTSDAKKFLNWIYKDANYYLTRKYLKYHKYLKKSV